MDNDRIRLYSLMVVRLRNQPIAIPDTIGTSDKGFNPLSSTQNQSTVFLLEESRRPQSGHVGVCEEYS